MRTVSCCLVALALAACGEVVKAKPDAPADPPSVASVEPPRGSVMAKLTISGSNFGETQEGSTITIGGSAATVESWSDTSIVAGIPDVLPGIAPVVVTTGNGASDPEMVRVILPPRVYVENNVSTPPPGDGFDAITVMAFDATTGKLTELGVTSMGLQPQGFGGCITSLVLHEGTRRLFAGGADGVAVFAIDPVDGTLTHVTGSPFLNGDSGGGIDVDAAGNRLWRAGLSERVGVFDISPQGALAPVTGSPFTATPGPDVLAASRDGTYVYANTESSAFHGFSVTANGALTPLPGSPFMSGGFAFSITRRPGTDQLFISVGPTLQVWQPAPGTGIPAQIPGSPFSTAVPAGTPHHATFTPDNNRVYIGAQTNSYLLGMDVSASGAVTPLAGSPWNFTGTVRSFSCIAAARDSNHLIVTDESLDASGEAADVSVLALAPDGVPTHVTGSPFKVSQLNTNFSGLAITF